MTYTSAWHCTGQWVLNSLKLMNVRSRSLMQHWVAIVQSTLDHCTGNYHDSFFWHKLPNVPQRCQVRVRGLTHTVDVFTKWERTVNYHTRLHSAGHRHGDVFQVNYGDVSFSSMSRCSPNYDGFCFVRIQWQSVNIEPMTNSVKTIS
jgi:hypothetical protein